MHLTSVTSSPSSSTTRTQILAPLGSLSDSKARKIELRNSKKFFIFFACLVASNESKGHCFGNQKKDESIHMPVILMLVTLLLCAIIILAAAGAGSSLVIAQQEEEETSLGEKGEDLVGRTVLNFR